LYSDIRVETKLFKPCVDLVRYCYFTSVSILTTADKNSRAMNKLGHDILFTGFSCMIGHWPLVR